MCPMSPISSQCLCLWYIIFIGNSSYNSSILKVLWSLFCNFNINFVILHFRSFIFPFALAPQAKPAPVATMLSAVVFCGYNGFLQGHHLLNTYTVSTSPLAVLLGKLYCSLVHIHSWNTLYFNCRCLISGVPLFFFGMYVNARSDRMLIALRKDAKKDADGKTEYKIPRGFLFEYISGANYFGEIVEWWALALITQGYPQVCINYIVRLGLS